MYNAQGGHVLFNLQTQAIITRTVGLVKAPITPTTSQMVPDLGRNQGITKLEIHDRKKKLIWDSSWLAGVNYDPYDKPDDPDYHPEEPFTEDDDEPLQGFGPIEDDELQDDDEIQGEDDSNPAQVPNPQRVTFQDQGMHVMDLEEAPINPQIAGVQPPVVNPQTVGVPDDAQIAGVTVPEGLIGPPGEPVNGDELEPAGGTAQVETVEFENDSRFDADSIDPPTSLQDIQALALDLDSLLEPQEEVIEFTNAEEEEKGEAPRRSTRVSEPPDRLTYTNFQSPVVAKCIHKAICHMMAADKREKSINETLTNCFVQTYTFKK